MGRGKGGKPPKEKKLKLSKKPKCVHDVRSFTFQDGGTIRCCMKLIPHVDKDGKSLWHDRCTFGDAGRVAFMSKLPRLSKRVSNAE